MSSEDIYETPHGTCRVCGAVTEHPAITECAKCVDTRLWNRKTNERIPASQYKDPVYYNDHFYPDVESLEGYRYSDDRVFGSRKVFLGLSASDLCERLHMEYEELDYGGYYDSRADEAIKDFVDAFNEKWGQWCWDIDYSVSICFPKTETLEELSTKTAKKLDGMREDLKKG